MNYTSLDESTPLILDPHKAYQDRDIEASVAFHNLRRSMVPVEQHTNMQNNYSMPVILSGIQGILISISTIYAVIASGLPLAIIPILGIAHMISDGISFGAGETFSALSERDYINEEMAREKWELEVNQQGEIDEMVDIYEELGMDRHDAVRVWNIYSKYPRLFLKVMLSVECGIIIPNEHDSPILTGIVKAISFAICSFIPLFPFVFSNILQSYYSWSIPVDYQYAFSFTLSGASLFALGVARANVIRSTRSKWLVSGVQILMLGSVSALCSYILGLFCSYFLSTPLSQTG